MAKPKSVSLRTPFSVLSEYSKFSGCEKRYYWNYIYVELDYQKISLNKIKVITPTLANKTNKIISRVVGNFGF